MMLNRKYSLAAVKKIFMYMYHHVFSIHVFSANDDT